MFHMLYAAINFIGFLKAWLPLFFKKKGYAAIIPYFLFHLIFQIFACLLSGEINDDNMPLIQLRLMQPVMCCIPYYAPFNHAGVLHCIGLDKLVCLLSLVDMSLLHCVSCLLILETLVFLQSNMKQYIYGILLIYYITQFLSSFPRLAHFH